VEPAVFLDRDNTLIANDGDLGDPDQVHILDGVPAGLLALRKAGFRLVVVTNQAGVARGKFTEADVDAVHQRIASLVEDATGSESLIDRFYYCPYHPEGTKPEYRRDHSWRKPHPGMLVQAARDMGLDLSRSWLVGDQVRDIRAGKAAGCRTVILNSEVAVVKEANPTVAVVTFGEAVDAILRRNPGARDRDQTEDAEPAQRSEPKPQDAKDAKDASTVKSEAGKVAGETARASTAVMVEPRTKPQQPHQRDVERAAWASTETTTSAPLDSTSEITDLKRAVVELSEEIRSQRVHKTEFTLLKLAAGACQLLVLLLVLLGLLEVNELEAFAKWFLGAVVAQLVTIALLLLDMRG